MAPSGLSTSGLQSSLDGGKGGGKTKGKEKGKSKDKGKSKGDGKGKKGKKGPDHGINTEVLKNAAGKRICVYFQVNQCAKGDKCEYAHERLTTPQQHTAAQQVRDYRSRSATPAPAVPATEGGAQRRKRSRRGRSRSAAESRLASQ